MRGKALYPTVKGATGLDQAGRTEGEQTGMSLIREHILVEAAHEVE